MKIKIEVSNNNVLDAMYVMPQEQTLQLFPPSVGTPSVASLSSLMGDHEKFDPLTLEEAMLDPLHLDGAVEQQEAAPADPEEIAATQAPILQAPNDTEKTKHTQDIEDDNVTRLPSCNRRLDSDLEIIAAVQVPLLEASNDMEKTAHAQNTEDLAHKLVEEKQDVLNPDLVMDPSTLAVPQEEWQQMRKLCGEAQETDSIAQGSMDVEHTFLSAVSAREGIVEMLLLEAPATKCDLSPRHGIPSMCRSRSTGEDGEPPPMVVTSSEQRMIDKHLKERKDNDMFNLLDGWISEKFTTVMGMPPVATIDALANAHKELDHQNHKVRIMQLLSKVLPIKEHAELNVVVIQDMVVKSQMHETRFAMEDAWRVQNVKHTLNLGQIVETAIETAGNIFRWEAQSREEHFRSDVSKLIYNMQERIDQMQRPVRQEMRPDPWIPSFPDPRSFPPPPTTPAPAPPVAPPPQPVDVAPVPAPSITPVAPVQVKAPPIQHTTRSPPSSVPMPRVLTKAPPPILDMPSGLVIQRGLSFQSQTPALP